MMRLLFALLCLLTLTLTLPCHAQAPRPMGTVYRWQPFDDGDPAQLKLVADGRQVGVYVLASGLYYPCDTARGWVANAPCLPPVEAPQRFAFGADVDASRIHPGRVSVCGRECSTEEAERLIAGGKLADDSMLQRLTIIGPEADRKRVLADWMTAPELLPFRAKCVVKDYAPDNWAVRDAGFVTTGAPTIYLQAADGAVLHRQDGYASAKSLAVALRRAQPDYDPSKDQDLAKQPDAKPCPAAPDSLLGLPASALWLVAGALPAAFLLRKKAVPSV